MTERLYYADSTLTDFEASIVESRVVDDRPHVVLDRTAFYPTSGGQPFDTGHLGTARVIEVIDRDDDEIVHVLDRPIGPTATVLRGAVDWPRRFDHMQQHTGQHILSAAFDREISARTTSFHLGADSATIDLDREVTPAQIGAAEQLANRVVWEDRLVGVRFATSEEASRLRLRKEPARTGLLRLIDVTDFDLSACGGTHVPRTGMIGVIAIGGWERFKGGSRVTFLCGGRALRSHGALRDATAESAKLLSVSVAELPGAIARLQADVKASAKVVRDLQQEVALQRAETFRGAAETLGGFRGVLRHEAGWDQSGLKALAAAIVGTPGFVTVLVGSGQPAPIVVARSADVTFDAARWILAATAKFGGRGGGRPELAQGGVPATPEEILAWARDDLGGRFS